MSYFDVTFRRHVLHVENTIVCISCSCIRVKPRTSHERAIMKENWGEQGGGEKEDEEVNIKHILVHNPS